MPRIVRLGRGPVRGHDRIPNGPRTHAPAGHLRGVYDGDPALVKADWLAPPSYDVQVTRIDKPPFNAKTAVDRAAGAQPTGPIMSNEVPFQLVAGEPRQIASSNGFRKGMMLQNLDLTQNLFYAFGKEANALSTFIAPLGQTLFLDFTCPCNSVWCFATVNLSGYYRDFSPSG